MQELIEKHAIHETRALLAAIAEASDEAIIRLDLAGIMLSWNPAAERLYGYTAREALGQPLAMLLPPHGRDPLWQLLARLAQGQDVRRLETLHLGKDGRRVHVCLTVVPLRDAAGRVVGGASLHRDLPPQRPAAIGITRTQAEAALAIQQPLLQAILEQTVDGIAVRDVEGRIVFANAALKRLAWMPPEGTSFAEAPAVWGETRDAAGTLVPVDAWPVSRALRGETVTGVEWHRTAPDGRRYVILNSAAPLRDAQGGILGAVTITTDITERKQAEEALVAQKRLLEAVLEQATDGMIVCGSDGKLLFVNAAARRMAQHDPSGASLDRLEYNWGRAFSPDGRPIPPEEYAMAVALRGQAVAGREMRVVRDDGSASHLLMSSVPLLDERHAIVGAIATFAEIDALKKAETDLRVALAEKEFVLREIGHRFKNNLQMLSSLLTLQSAAVASPEARDALEASQRRVLSMAQLQEQLYRSAGQHPVRMPDYIRRVTDSLKDSYGRPEVALRIAVDDLLLEPERAMPLGLIVSELVTNAFKHACSAGQAGEIGVSLTRSGPTYRLRVWDTGPGLLPGTAADPASLGLRLVDLLGKRLQGAMTLEVCGGAVFTFTFPVEPEE